MSLSDLIATYGYGLVALIVALESTGLPLPGEATLLTAAIYAGTTHRLSIVGVIAAAAAGAILGDNVGFWIGREAGYRLLVRYGPRIGITEGKIKLGRYLFMRHGGKVVFFGRFVAVLRALGAFLAGANRMPWASFLVYNAAGGIVWSALYGGAAYALGAQVHRFLGPIGYVALGLAVIAIGVGWFFLRSHEARLEAEAQRALPGPLTAP